MGAMLRFSTDVALGDHVIRVEGDDFREFHDAVARLVELDRESALLYEAGAERVLAERHKDRDGNEYWGLCDASDPRHTVTFGQFREGTAVSLPFFPKSDGHYVPEGYVPVRSLHADAERQRDEVVGLPPEGEPIALLSEAEVEQVAGVLRRQGWTRAEVHRLLTSRWTWRRCRRTSSRRWCGTRRTWRCTGRSGFTCSDGRHERARD